MAQIAAYLTPEGIKQTPIVTERTITNKDNRIRLGESLVIGGIRKSEKRDVIRGVPILKDIPILNLLFSGRDFEERATEVIFILTPSISTKGKPNKDMVEMLKDRHASPASRGLPETVLDPLGTKARREEEERRLDTARVAQQESEAEMTAARLQAIQTGQQVEDLEAETREEQGQDGATECRRPNRPRPRPSKRPRKPSKPEPSSRRRKRRRRSRRRQSRPRTRATSPRKSPNRPGRRRRRRLRVVPRTPSRRSKSKPPALQQGWESRPIDNARSKSVTGPWIGSAA